VTAARKEPATAVPPAASCDLQDVGGLGVPPLVSRQGVLGRGADRATTSGCWRPDCPCVSWSRKTGRGRKKASLSWGGLSVTASYL